MALVDWNIRPQDVANLLNPAFGGLLLHRALTGHKNETGSGMPLELVFLVLPFVLHEPTRSRLPVKVTTHLATWLQNERDVLLQFGERTADLVPYTQESILFLATHGLVEIDKDGRLFPGRAKFKQGVGSVTTASDEVHDCYRAAFAVGRWLSLSGNSTTLYSMLGIRP